MRTFPLNLERKNWEISSLLKTAYNKSLYFKCQFYENSKLNTKGKYSTMFEELFIVRCICFCLWNTCFLKKDTRTSYFVIEHYYLEDVNMHTEMCKFNAQMLRKYRRMIKRSSSFRHIFLKHFRNNFNNKPSQNLWL